MATEERRVTHATLRELEEGLAEIRRSPRGAGTLRMIVRRPRPGAREVLEEAELDPIVGLVGDDWSRRGSAHTPDGAPHPETQLTLMNARVIALVAREESRWPLAGDQLFVELDLGEESLPPGARLRAGSAVIEITPTPHTGCKKFLARFGADALRFVNARATRSLRLRGVNARVLRRGRVRRGDLLRRIDLEADGGAAE